MLQLCNEDIIMVWLAWNHFKIKFQWYFFECILTPEMVYFICFTFDNWNRHMASKRWDDGLIKFYRLLFWNEIAKQTNKYTAIIRILLLWGFTVIQMKRPLGFFFRGPFFCFKIIHKMLNMFKPLYLFIRLSMAWIIIVDRSLNNINHNQHPMFIIYIDWNEKLCQVCIIDKIVGPFLNTFETICPTTIYVFAFLLKQCLIQIGCEEKEIALWGFLTTFQ